MNRLLVGIFIWAAATSSIFVVGQIIEPETPKEPKTVIVFWDKDDHRTSSEDGEQMTEVEIQMLRLGPPRVAEKIRNCGISDMHFYPSKGLHDRSSVAVFWAGQKQAHTKCVEQLMRDNIVNWTTLSITKPVELALP